MPRCLEIKGLGLPSAHSDQGHQLWRKREKVCYMVSSFLIATIGCATEENDEFVRKSEDSLSNLNFASIPAMAFLWHTSG